MLFKWNRAVNLVMRKLWSRRVLRRLLALMLGTLFAFVIAEIGLRTLGVSYPLPYVPDPYCSSRLRPGMTAWFTKEGKALVSINQAGNRDIEHTIPKPTNCIRIAVLGDSFAEALQVPMEDTFWAVLQQELVQRQAFNGLQVEVLNFGVSGFGTTQELEMLRRYVWQYEPDIILLAVTTGNDVRENSRELSWDKVRPYYVVDPVTSTIVLDQSFRQHPFYLDAMTGFSRFKVTCINRLRVLQVVREVRAQRLAAKRRAAAATEANETESPVEEGLDAIYHEPQSDAWKEAWHITEQLLLMVRDEVQSHHAQLWVVTLSNSIQVDPRDEVRKEELDRAGLNDFFYPEHRIATLGEREGFAVITLAPAMLRYAQENNIYLHGFANTRLGTGHWNSEGHWIAGMLIAEQLSAKQRHGPGTKSPLETLSFQTESK